MKQPQQEGKGRQAHHDRDEPGGYPVGQALYRRPRTLGVLHQAYDLRQCGILPHAGGR